MNTETGKIYEAIPLIMSEIKAISKDRSNTQQGYKFRGIDDVLNELHPLLAKHKVFIVPTVISETREERKSSQGKALIYSILNIAFRFYASDGSFIEAKTIGEGMDSGDKASNKAMSVAVKYACIFVFAIETEDPKDPENDNPEPLPKPALRPASQTPKVTERRLAIHKRLNELITAKKTTKEKIEELKKSEFGRENVTDDELEQLAEMLEADNKQEA